MSRRQASPANVFARLWSKAFAAGRRKAVLSQRPRVRLQLEHLEDRVVPAVIDVTTLADGVGAGTLRSAIAQANTNDANGDITNTINLTVAGNYNVGQSGLGGLAIFTNATATQSGLSLTIQNTSGGNVAISGDNTNRIFDINPNDIIQTNPNVALGAVTINGVTIENGLASDAANADGPNASGGGIRDQGPVDLTLNNDTLTNNSATADGGGVSMENLTSTHWALMLNNTTVTNNHAGDAGGGVEEDGTGLVSITNSTIADNTTLNQGAGIWLDAIGTGTATLNVTNSIVSGNTAGMVGGGIGQAGSSTVTITGSTIANNFTVGFGGGFGDQNNLGTLVVSNSLFLNNSAGTNGGGIQEGGPSTTITNSEIKGNAAGINGAMPIGTAGGAPNAVMGSGGGLFINGGALTLTNSTIAGNTATIDGGGIELQTTTASTITNSTIVGNSALNSGGLGNGGGIDDAATGTVALVNDTITNNGAVNGGGLFFAGSTGLTLQNTILALNTVTGTGPDFDFTGTPSGVDLGGNLIGIGAPTIFTAGTTQQGTVGSPLNPLITGLTNNGGPLAGAPGNQMTVETEALLPGSPAIGKGVANGLTTDQRGAPRVNTNDIGAFQFEAVTLNLNIGTQATLVINTTETVSVTVTNNSGNPLPADNSILTVTASGGLNIGGTQTFTLGPIAAGQSQTFTFNATGTGLGTQTITARVTSVDTNPATTTTTTTVNVTQTTTQPIGTLTLFAFGFGPTGIDLFEVDSKGVIWAVAFPFGGAPIFVNTTLVLPLAALENGSLLAFLTAASGQNFLIDIINPFAPGVLGAVIAGLHL
ncbi:MAG: beta strand repeat-containing protein [Gemmataceae bacterium]